MNPKKKKKKLNRYNKKSKTKRYNILIAVDLIPWIKELEQNPPSIIGFTISRMEYIISLIISHKQDKHLGAYSVLKMEYIQNVVPQANDYLDFLLDKNIIERINYFAGRNSYMYRLLNEGKTEYRAITDKELINRIENNREEMKKRNSKKYPILNSFIRKVKIDYEEAIKTVELTYQENIRKGNEKAEGRRTFSLGEINKIDSRDIYIKINDTNERLDSNFTRLPSELVPHLTIDGNSLTEIDIRCSQPFFSSTLFFPKPEIINVLNDFLGRSHTMSVLSLHIYDCVDVKLYSSLVITGKFYEYMMEKFKENDIAFIDRDDLKEKMFIVLFGKREAFIYNKAARLFKELFPNVQKLFDLIKKDEHNMLSVLLQRIESYTIIKRTVQNVISELPGLPFLTKHDSLLPSQNYLPDEVNKVKLIMLSTIREVTGLTPQLKIKSDSNLKIRV